MSVPEDTTKFDASFAGIAQMLRSEMVGLALEGQAKRVLDRAKSLAPVSETSAHPGRYRDSFKVRVGLNRRRSRVEAVVYNDSPEALMVEKGTINNPPYNVLTRALDILRAGGKGL